MERAVIDRIEGDLAVLLVGEDERELLVPVRDLPAGSGPGVWLRIALEEGQLQHADIDRETTRIRKSRIQGMMDRLLGKGRK